MDKVVILSGGLDSTTLLYFIKKQFPEDKIGAISFDYGQKHRKEIDSAIQTCIRLSTPIKVISMRMFSDLAPSSLTRPELEIPKGHYIEESMKSTVVPNRNMVLLSLAISYSIGQGASKVYYGAHAGDHAIYPDCRPEFVEAMRHAAVLCDWKPILIEAPFLKLDKIQIVSLGLGLGVDYSKTWTCYEGRDLACGKCGSCTERLEAFTMNGVEDPIKYEEKLLEEYEE